MTKRSHGDGGIDQRGEDSYRLRYRLNGKRYSVAFHGTLSDARKKLRELIRSGDTGQHIEPDRMTVAVWIEDWLAHKTIGLRFHDLRGSHATMLLDAGVPVHTVAKRLGHSAAVSIANLHDAIEQWIAEAEAQGRLKK